MKRIPLGDYLAFAVLIGTAIFGTVFLQHIFPSVTAGVESFYPNPAQIPTGFRLLTNTYRLSFVLPLVIFICFLGSLRFSFLRSALAFSLYALLLCLAYLVIIFLIITPIVAQGTAFS